MNHETIIKIHGRPVTVEKAFFHKSACEKFAKFILGNRLDFCIEFPGGIFIAATKCEKNLMPYLEISSSGYDDTIPLDDALYWVKYRLLDLKACGILA